MHIELPESTSNRLLSRRAARAAEQPISRLMSAALDNPDIISLAAGFVDHATLPIDHVLSSASRILEDEKLGQTALQYGTNQGMLTLRREIAKRNFAESTDTLSDHMVLTAGSNQLLHLVCHCLMDEGDLVLCAAPTYFVFLGLLQDHGVRAIGLESDDEGITPESLERCLSDLHDSNELARVKAIYMVPYFDNPCGRTVSLQRRIDLIEIFNHWHAKSQMILLIDNAYRDLRYEGEDVPTFLDLGADRDWIVESGTFSKNFAPGVRVGWGVLPDWLLEPALRTKAVMDFGSAHFNQRLMIDVLETGNFDRQVARLRTMYSGKLRAMLEACSQYLAPIEGVEYHAPRGGLYVWLTLPPGMDAGLESELWSACVAGGVLYVPGEFCFPAEGAPVQTNSARLSFGVQSEDNIRRGIEILGSTIRSIQT